MSSKKKEIINTLALVFAAFLWGTTFVAQSEGSKIIGPYTFLAGRGWIGIVFLYFVVRANDRALMKRTGRTAKPQNALQWRRLIGLGFLCGTLLFAASYLQQSGIHYTTTAKSSFITAMYVVLVPVFSIFAKKFPSVKVWICVALSVIGLYLLCMKPGESGFGYGDLLTLASAVFFSFQILSINYSVQLVDGIRLSWWQTFSMGLIATVFMAVFEKPSITSIVAALPALLYAGVLSTGVAYTLQIVGQRNLNPTVASLAMCLESVFGALAGWLVQGQELSGRELAGCAIMFAAIVLSNIDFAALGGKADGENDISC
ncbi:MAG: DMT family transporter [Lachnospiraceae bacterium]